MCVGVRSHLAVRESDHTLPPSWCGVALLHPVSTSGGTCRVIVIIAIHVLCLPGGKRLWGTCNLAVSLVAWRMKSSIVAMLMLVG